MRNHNDCIQNLQSAGIGYEDACALRRISMTLHRWHELECGDGNDYGSWAIVRGRKEMGKTVADREEQAVNGHCFVHDDDGKPYLEHHHYRHGQGMDSTTYTPLADRERGAIKRLDKIMARYPGFARYIQTDPRGCALYILRPGDLAENENPEAGAYCRGIAVFK